MGPPPASEREPDRVRVVTWNLFHGRDDPPEKGLRTWPSRLLGGSVRGDRYLQVSRPLLVEFGTAIARDGWAIALLQEVSPGWLRPLCRATGASGASALTSRNLGAFLRAPLAAWNPDLLASSAGGSNQILVRPPWRLTEVRRMTLTRRPQRRRMLLARLEHQRHPPLAVACVHLSSHSASAASTELQRAAAAAVEWANGIPLLFGGDLNLRPRTSPTAFDLLRDEYGLIGSTSCSTIDHLLWNGKLSSPAVELDPRWRELSAGDGLRIRLSDHSAVARELGLEGR